MAREWLARVRTYLDERPSTARFLVTGQFPVWLPYAALRAEALEWLDVTAEARSPYFPAASREADELIAVARSLLSREPEAAGEHVGAFGALSRGRGGEAPAALATVLFAREARRRQLALAESWRASLDSARAFAERAKARWFLTELDELEAGAKTS